MKAEDWKKISDGTPTNREGDYLFGQFYGKAFESETGYIDEDGGIDFEGAHIDYPTHYLKIVPPNKD